MIRLTLALAVSLYAGLVIWGDPVAEATAATTSAATDAAVIRSLASGPGYDRPVILGDGTEAAPQVTRAATARIVVPDSAAIAAASPVPRAPGEPVLVSLVPVDAALEPTAASAAAADAEPGLRVTGDAGTRLRVTGDRVNMRAGPSTADAVVGSLVAGTLADPMGEPQDGWIEIRVVETGTTGFMAARFLGPA